MTNVIVFMQDEDNARVVPLKEDDSDTVRDIKLFMLATLHRRRLDPSFDADMRAWLRTVSEDDLKSGTKVN